MIAFLGCAMIFIVISWMITLVREKMGKSTVDNNNVMIPGIIIAIVLGIGASFWGGSCVKQKIVVEKYFISPMCFEGKPIAALIEEHSPLTETYNCIFQIKVKGEKLKFIKLYLKKRDISFSLNKDEERHLEIKKRVTCRKRMWIWFFYKSGSIESKAALLKEEDNFLTIPKYSSL